MSYSHTSVAITTFLITTSLESEQPTPTFIIASGLNVSIIICVHSAAFTLPGEHCTTATITLSIVPQTKVTPAISVSTASLTFALMFATSTSIAPMIPSIILSP